MVTCETDCITKPLQNIFEKFGEIVYRYRWVFLISPLIISAALGAGLYFRQERVSNSIEDNFLPNICPAITERAFIKDHFPQGEEFSSLRLYTDGILASLIIVNSTNILTKEAFQEIVRLDQRVKQIQATESLLTLSDLCTNRNGECVSNPILDVMNSFINTEKSVSYPLNNGQFIGTAVGGVSQNRDNIIESAQAIRLFYYLKDGKKNETDLWLKTFQQNFSENTVSEMVCLNATSRNKNK
ncbi:patched domain-containing protein 3-like [Alosa pseudoharengus]|uniref:patched domain-containing protein 3-like n=1 Tax=Alosa pseudoharengus TaxID=34774 RepID=UPI003F8C2013